MNAVIREPRLLDRLRNKVRLRGYSRATEKSYAYWAKRYVLFHDKRHPAEMGIGEVEAFLSSLAVRESASASTQNQALSALLFLYRHVLEQPIASPVKALRARQYHYIPTVLSIDEVQRLFAGLSGTLRLMAELTYGSGLRVSETLGLRVQDVDVPARRILVRDGKGRKDRFTILPESLVGRLQRHLVRVKEIHVDDLVGGHGASVMPRAYARRMPHASRDFIWQFVFPSSSLFPRPADRRQRSLACPQEHLAESGPAGRTGRGHPQAGIGPYPEVQLRHPPPAGRLRCPPDPGAAGAQPCQHDHGLCSYRRWAAARRDQSAGRPRHRGAAMSIRRAGPRLGSTHAVLACHPLFPKLVRRGIR